MRRAITVCLLAICFVRPAAAGTLTEDLRFAYSQSLGPATSATSQPPAAAFPHPSYAFVFSPSPGQSASHSSKITVEFEDQLDAPGSTRLKFDVGSVNASFREFAGFGGSVGLGISPFNNTDPLVSLSIGLAYDVRSSGHPGTGQSIYGSQTRIASGLPGLGIPFIFEAVVAPSIKVDTRLRFGGIQGILSYRNRETGITETERITLRTSTTFVDLDLDEPGLYDFSFNPQTLENTLMRTTKVGVGFDVELFGGGLLDNPPTIDFTQSVNSRSLGFKAHSADRADMRDWFTIDVRAVPEPSSMALAACGAIGVVVCVGRRRGKRQP